ncbi:hypothetical protein ABPG75_010073 [Micractinium tetrahymenae]
MAAALDDRRLPTISGSLWWAQFLLVSRLYNPGLPITAIVNDRGAVQASPVGAALAAAGGRLAAIEAVNAPGSRGARLEAAAAAIYASYLHMWAPGHPCTEPGGMEGERCRAALGLRMRLLARFCWQADLAAADDADYVLTMDADAMLTDDLRAALLEQHMRGVDVLTFTEWSSQESGAVWLAGFGGLHVCSVGLVVLWRREALDAFCDAQVEMLSMDRQSLYYVFKAGRGGSMDQEWNDMNALQAFLRAQRPDLARVVLCGTPSSDDQELCRSLVWKAAQAASYLPARSDSDQRRDYECARLDEYVEWRLPQQEEGTSGGDTYEAGDSSTSSRGGSSSRGSSNGSGSGSATSSRAVRQVAAGGPSAAAPAVSAIPASGHLPEPRVRWQWYDLPEVLSSVERSTGLKERHYGPPQRLPLIHWQGYCKETGSRYVRRYYEAAGLIPSLGSGCDRDDDGDGVSDACSTGDSGSEASSEQGGGAVAR